MLITPWLCWKDCGDIIEVRFPSGTRYTFEKQGGGSYQQIHGIGASLSHSGGSASFYLTLPGGDVWRFRGMDDSDFEGYFEQLTTPGGRYYYVSFGSDGFTQIEATWSEGGNSYGEKYTFAYYGEGDDNAGEVESITHQNKCHSFHNSCRKLG